MAIRPSNPEIITVNSEALQTQIRDLLPSQNGFGSELQASNVITPIIDLTAAAEGSGLPVSLQQATSFGSQTNFSAQNSTAVIANSPGFYRIFGTSSGTPTTSQSGQTKFDMSDGSSTKTIWALDYRASANEPAVSESFDFIVFLAAGDSISAVSDAVNFKIQGSSRQVATGDGTLVQPNGFPL